MLGTLNTSRLATAGAIAMTIATQAGSTGDENKLDLGRQGTNFQRIFRYDKHLRDSQRIVVLVVSNSTDDRGAKDVAKAFRDSGLYPAIVKNGDLNDYLVGALDSASAVVYVTKGSAFLTSIPLLFSASCREQERY